MRWRVVKHYRIEQRFEIEADTEDCAWDSACNTDIHDSPENSSTTYLDEQVESLECIG